MTCRIKLNKEVNKIIKSIIKDEESGFTILSTEEYNVLVARIRELEIILNTEIVFEGFGSRM